MSFISNHIQNLINDKLINSNNPDDVSYVLMLMHDDNARDIAATMLETHVQTNSLIAKNKYDYKKDMLSDFEIGSVRVPATRNARIRGGHAKTSTYGITCKNDLQYFCSEVMGTFDQNLMIEITKSMVNLYMLQLSIGISVQYVLDIAKKIKVPVSEYKAMSIAYYINHGRRFVIKQEHIDHMNSLYMSVCSQLLGTNITANKNIPKPLSLIYIAMRQNDITRHKELKDFMMTGPITASIAKINDISNGIFGTKMSISK